jgi:hypothetical protein
VTMIDVTVAGSDELAAQLAGLPGLLRSRLSIAFAGIAAALYERVLEKLDGDVLRVGTGRLKGAITQQSDGLSASVGVDTGIAPYGPALEFGASIPAQLIAVKNAKALAFVVAGQQVFAKHAMRPAFVLPPHSFLRSALDEMAPDILAQLDAAVAAAVSS